MSLSICQNEQKIISQKENKLKKDLSLTFDNTMKYERSFNSKDVFFKGELNGIQQEMKTQKNHSLFLFRI